MKCCFVEKFVLTVSREWIRDLYVRGLDKRIRVYRQVVQDFI